MVFGFSSFAHTVFIVLHAPCCHWIGVSYDTLDCLPFVVLEIGSNLVAFLIIRDILGIYLGHQVMFLSFFIFCLIELFFLIMHVYRSLLPFFPSFSFCFVLSLYLISSP